MKIIKITECCDLSVHHKLCTSNGSNEGHTNSENIGMPVDYSGRNMPGFTKKKP